MFAITDTAFAALIKPLLDGSFVEKDPDNEISKIYFELAKKIKQSYL